MILLLFGCKDNEVKYYEQEVQKLETNSQKREFLEEIYAKDQDIRNKIQNLRTNHGVKSDIYKQAIEKLHTTDSQNLEKLQLYLTYHDHPQKKVLGDQATLTPWLIAHHTSKLNSKKEVFPYLYKAYKNSDLDAGKMSTFLARWYFSIYGKRLKLPNPYREEQMIDSLIKDLKLVSMTQEYN